MTGSTNFRVGVLGRALLAVLMVPVVVLLVATAPAGASETYVVTSTGDGADTNVGDGDCIAIGGGCTLRAAIQETNDDNDLDTIEFALGGPGTIAAGSPLPGITEPLVIDGSTNPGANCDYLGEPAQPAIPTVAISGSALVSGIDALTIRNLSIHSTPTAIDFGELNEGYGSNGQRGFVVECSWIGVKLDGTLGAGQFGRGVVSSVFRARVGGTLGEPGNVIAGFDGAAVVNAGSVLENRIGVLSDGSPAGNGEGVLGGSDIRFNLIANSAGDGVTLDQGTVSFNTIRDNGGNGITLNSRPPVPPPPGPGAQEPLTDFEDARGNTIFNNGGLGIDRALDAATEGPDNDRVAITSVDGNSLSFRLRGVVGEDHEIGVFINTECDPSGFGEGEAPGGTFTVVPGAAETFHTVAMANPLAAGSSVSVTATVVSPLFIETSEFSNCASENDRFVVDIETNDSDVSPGDGVCLGSFGGCSLRAAIEEANALGGAETEEIVFDLAAGTSVAVSGSPLPAITVPVIIDATLNAGATCGNAASPPSGLIRLNAAPGVDVGLELAASASGSEVRGLEFGGFSTDGVLVLGDDNVFECNVFGSATSTGNLGDGIDVRGDGNAVGGSSASQGNLVVGNQLAGVRLLSSAFNVVQSNWIGTDGTSAMPNSVGVSVGGNAADNRLGSTSLPDGSTPGGNIIGGNRDHGVEIVSSGAANQIVGNLIGVTEDGSPMGNGRHGIRVDAPGALVGRGRGAFAVFFDDPNVVGHNGESGMALFGDDAVVIGNFVGVDPDGGADLGNADHGIFLGGADGLLQDNVLGHNGRSGAAINGRLNEIAGNLIGVDPDGFTPAGNGQQGVDMTDGSNVIGGDNAADGNVIAFNARAGVRITNGATLNTVRNNTVRNNGASGIEVLGTATQNRLVGNSIVDNENLGIDLGGDGVANPNDKDDPDTGANDFVNRPEILDVNLGDSQILFSYQGTPGLAHEIEFSANLACDNSETGEGLRPIDGLLSFTTDGAGDFEGVFDAQGGFVAGEILTALVTSTSFGGVPTTTSEYSACYQVAGQNQTDTDGDGLFDVDELDDDTDGDGLVNRLDADDDGDGRPTNVENADPNFDGDPSDALNSDSAGPVDYLDPAELFRLLDPACQVLQTGTVNGGDSIDFSVSGGVALAATSDTQACEIPGGATAVMANVIVVDPVTEGNLRLTAAGTTPLGGIVNFSANELDNTNAQSVPVSAGGELNVSVNLGGGSTAVAAGGIEVEILGYYQAAETPSLVFNTVTPCTVYDTRPSQGGSGPVTADVVFEADVVGSFPSSQGGGNVNCQVPDGAEGLLVNVVALNTAGIVDVASTITGATLVSNQTHTPTMNNSSAVTLPIDDQGRVFISVDVSGSTNLRLVVLGHYFPTMVGSQAAAGLEFRSVIPCAAFDTRSGQGSSGSFAGQRTNGQATDYDVIGSFDPAQGGGNSDCAVPASAQAVELNLVAINASREGNLLVVATGVTPTGGVLNFANLTPKMNNSNALVVPVSSGGEITVTTNGGAANGELPITDIRGIISGFYIFQFDQG